MKEGGRKEEKRPRSRSLCKRRAKLARANRNSRTLVVRSWADLNDSDQARSRQESEMADQDILAALDRHWAASEAGDDDAEDEIYHDDAVLEYPQSGERIRGRLAIRTTRGLLPNKHFAIRRVIGRGDLWVTEYVISYDGKPSHTVSIMEFRDGKVFRETQYFGDPFEPWSGRAQWVEPID